MNDAKGASLFIDDRSLNIELTELLKILRDAVIKDEALSSNINLKNNKSLMVSIEKIFLNIIHDKRFSKIHHLFAVNNNLNNNIAPNEKKLFSGLKIDDMDEEARVIIGQISKVIRDRLLSIQQTENMDLAINDKELKEHLMSGFNSVVLDSTAGRNRGVIKDKSQLFNKCYENISNNSSKILTTQLIDVDATEDKGIQKNDLTILSAAIKRKSLDSILDALLARYKELLIKNKDLIAEDNDLEEDEIEDYLERLEFSAKGEIDKYNKSAMKMKKFLDGTVESSLLMFLTTDFIRNTILSEKNYDAVDEDTIFYFKTLLNTYDAFSNDINNKKDASPIFVKVPADISRFFTDNEINISDFFSKKTFYDFLPVSLKWNSKGRELEAENLSERIFHFKFSFNGVSPDAMLPKFTTTRKIFYGLIETLWKLKTGDYKGNEVGKLIGDFYYYLPKAIFLRALITMKNPRAGFSGDPEEIFKALNLLSENFLEVISKKIDNVVSNCKGDVTIKNILQDSDIQKALSISFIFNTNEKDCTSPLDLNYFMNKVSNGIREMISKDLSFINFDTHKISVNLSDSVFNISNINSGFIKDLNPISIREYVSIHKTSDITTKGGGLCLNYELSPMIKRLRVSKENSSDLIVRHVDMSKHRLMVFPIINYREDNSSKNNYMSELQRSFLFKRNNCIKELGNDAQELFPKNNIAFPGLYVILPDIEARKAKSGSDTLYEVGSMNRMLSLTFTYMVISELLIKEIISQFMQTSSGFPTLSFLRLQKETKGKSGIMNIDDLVVSSTQAIVNSLSKMAVTQMQGVSLPKILAERYSGNYAYIMDTVYASLISSNNLTIKSDDLNNNGAIKKMALITLNIRIGFNYCKDNSDVRYIGIGRSFLGDIVGEQCELKISRFKGFTEEFSEKTESSLSQFSDLLRDLYSMGYKDIAVIQSRYSQNRLDRQGEKVDKLSFSLYEKLCEEYQDINIYPLTIDKTMSFRSFDASNAEKNKAYEIRGVESLNKFTKKINENYLNEERSYKIYHKPIYMIATLHVVKDDNNLKSHRGLMTYFLKLDGENKNNRNFKNAFRLLDHNDTARYDILSVMLRALHFGMSEKMPMLSKKFSSQIMPVLEPLSEVQGSRGIAQRSEIVINKTRNRNFIISLSSLMHNVSKRIINFKPITRGD